MLKFNNIKTILNNQTIIKPFTAHVVPGDFVIIVGQNGAGKSTLLNNISGKIKISSGDILLNKKSINSLDETSRANLIGQLNQNPMLNCSPSLTVKQNISIALLKTKKASLRNGLKSLKECKKAKEIQNSFSSKKILNKKMSELSGGQRQLIAFMMTTAISPKILILDEPTAALDLVASEKMTKLIKKHTKESQSITFMITHSIEEAASLGNKLWIIKNGKINQIDKTDKIIKTKDVKKLLN